VFAQRGKGAHIWDVDGNRYLDYTMAVGPLVLGYGNDVVDAAIREQLKDRDGAKSRHGTVFEDWL
jgi:glutamate-1-semialdehyde aminotransferase